MKHLIILALSFVLLSCAKGQQHNSNTAKSTLTTSSGSITNQWARGQFLSDLYVPKGATPSLNGGLPIRGAIFFDTLDYHVYQFDSMAADGITEVWSRMTNASDEGNFVTLNTVQTVAASKTWNSDQTFLANVGIGGTPSYPLDVQVNGGRLIFDGDRLFLQDTGTNFNILLGGAAGLNLNKSTDILNLGVGYEALKGIHGGSSHNTAVGYSIMRTGSGSNNTAVGYHSLYINSGDWNTAIGYAAAASNYGDSNLAIGDNSANAIELYQHTINNSEITVGTTAYSGASISAYIGANSLAVGQTYPFQLNFDGGAIPEPYNTAGTTGLFMSGVVVNSSTIAFNGDVFTTQGSGTATLHLLNKQYNAVAIGHKAVTDSSNQIALGNSNNSILKANKFVVYLKAIPTSGDVLTWDGTKYVPLAPTGGSGGNLVTSTFGRIGDVTALASDYAAFYPSLTGYNNTNWDVAYNKHPTAIAFSGTDTKTLTMTMQDGTTLTGSFTDNNSGGGTGIITLNGDASNTQSFATDATGTDFKISTAAGIHTWHLPIVSSVDTGKVTPAQKAVWDAKQNAIATGTTAQYLRGDGSLATFPTDLSSFANGPGYLTTTTGDARYPLLSGSYSNPSWLTGLAWSKITSKPTTLSGFGITDAVPATRTVNGKALSTNITLGYPDIGTVPIANGGTGQTTVSAAINALLPSQTGNSGKILSTDGTNISWITAPSGSGGTGGISQAQLDDTAAAIRADFPDCSVPAFTALSDVLEGSGTYTGAITTTATTVPSGTTNHTFYWTKFGHEVLLQMELSWSSAGTGVTKMILPLPAGMPAPLEPAGFTAANNTITYGSGGLSTDANSRTSTQSVVRLTNDAAGTGYQIVIESNSVGAGVGFINLHYRIP